MNFQSRKISLLTGFSVLAIAACFSNTAMAGTYCGSTLGIDSDFLGIHETFHTGDQNSDDIICNGTINAADLGTDSVGSAEIIDGAVGNSELADGAVDNAKIGSDAVTSDKIQDGAVGNDDLDRKSVV